MDKPIAVGDLVMVVRKAEYCGCCLGVTFRVIGFARPSSGYIHCSDCGSRTPSEMDAEGEKYWAPLSMLMRIDPPALEDNIPAKEELHA